MTAREFAGRVGLSTKTVSLIEGGHRSVRAWYAVRIAYELGTTVEYLFDHVWED
jgi:DNA-binding XRE family transcriptional regulator